MQYGPQLGYGYQELPFFYFQRVMDDGRLEVSCPAGYVTAVRPEDICDVAHGEPVVVRAMPHDVFVARLRLPHKERGIAPGPECFADAHVLRVVKDRWGGIDQVFVRFFDPALNIDKAWNAPVAPGERNRLAGLAKRTIMPVSSKSSRGANRSADHGMAAETAHAREVVRRFLGCATQGRRADVERLASVGAKSISRTALNKLPLLAATY